MDLSWISAIAPWLLTCQTALLVVGGFGVGIFSVIGFFVSIPLLQFLFPMTMPPSAAASKAPRGDAFDPSQNPGAPGAPRPLGSLAPAAKGPAQSF
jgi:hypothetical protein